MQLRWPATFALALPLLLAVVDHRRTLDVSRAPMFPAAHSGDPAGEPEGDVGKLLAAAPVEMRVFLRLGASRACAPRRSRP